MDAKTFPNVLLLVLLTGLSLPAFPGCATKNKTISAPVEPPASFSESGERVVPERWWTSLSDSALSAAIDTALHSNFNLMTAWQRLQAAQAIVDRESSALFPDLEGTAQAGVTRFFDSGQDEDHLSVGLSSVYEVDLWGRIDSQIEAEALRAVATLNDYQAAALSLSAEVVRVWYQLAEAKNQVQLIDNQIETNRKVLDLLESRFGSGQIRGVDILRQRQLLEATREQKIYAEAAVQVLQHQLAVLMGTSPQKSLAFAPQALPELPPLPETGIPVDLVRRRPDVLRAFHLLQAADQDLAAAISNQYPRLSLSASLSTSADNAGNLFEDWALSFAGNLIAPILYGGELQAEVDRISAVKQQRLYEYGQTILTAFREVEDALIREKKQRESLETIKRQIALAQKAYEQLRVQYINGSNNFLDVLTALAEIQQLRRSLLTERLNLVEYRISLYRALAGSFVTDRER